jgi:hypothetical protein
MEGVEACVGGSSKPKPRACPQRAREEPLALARSTWPSSTKTLTMTTTYTPYTPLELNIPPSPTLDDLLAAASTSNHTAAELITESSAFHHPLRQTRSSMSIRMTMHKPPSAYVHSISSSECVFSTSSTLSSVRTTYTPCNHFNAATAPSTFTPA